MFCEALVLREKFSFHKESFRIRIINISDIRVNIDETKGLLQVSSFDFLYCFVVVSKW